ncbi:MAG: hypothetical protein HY078_11990 [Elusimicrobia bacterium]|nr:hypothetical protein [Elusimicrobiota bacterium]
MMKWILIAGLAAALWFVWGRQKTEQAQKTVETGAAKIGQTLSNDVKRAEAAAETANKKIQETAQKVKEALPDEAK